MTAIAPEGLIRFPGVATHPPVMLEFEAGE
jgi:hypothetical protein